MTDPITIAFITGRGHSGSTLLDLLLSSHSEAVTVGECRFSPKLSASTCACGKPVTECAFWREVDKHLATQGLTLAGIDVWYSEPSTFLRHNEAFYRALAEVSNKRVIVDSSKNPQRMRALMQSRSLVVKPIHLVRRPHGVVFSYARKGRHTWLKQTLIYTKRVLQTRGILWNRDHRVVHYEDLAANPTQTIANLTTWLGLPFEPAQMSWVGKERHDCGGNRMRFSKDSTIRVDHAWESGLTSLQKLAISALTLPARP